ncbi:MAG: hypothetical protein U0359_03365 [Byssovorax sp.]
MRLEQGEQAGQEIGAVRGGTWAAVLDEQDVLARSRAGTVASITWSR